MAAHQIGESRFIAPANEPFEKNTIWRRALSAAQQSSYIPHQNPNVSFGHERGLLVWNERASSISAEKASQGTLFF
jgi:hypothetical protein